MHVNHHNSRTQLINIINNIKINEFRISDIDVMHGHKCQYLYSDNYHHYSTISSCDVKSSSSSLNDLNRISNEEFTCIGNSK